MPDHLRAPLENYLAAAASGEPTPGGGSVSALAGALGASMAAMAANFTVGKKQFAAVEPEARELLGKVEDLRKKLQELTQKDTEAYGAVSAAFKLPKAAPEEKTARKAAIAAACRGAMAVPLEALRACRETLLATRRLAEIANPNLISDVGVAALLLEAAAGGSALNVAVNLPSIGDRELAAAVQAELNATLADCARLSKESQDLVAAALMKGAG
ncbi:MAG TPA: cyclodeaminase/cyclohydrolase family protein [Planctomycetota bacterium]|nr:cyclodeaminase/cyclohydrolase family protein [Planctomycetota bacterium]